MCCGENENYLGIDGVKNEKRKLAYELNSLAVQSTSFLSEALFA
jgi:hypothetical protein